MKLSNVKHVFFDLDHTLWDFDKNSALTFEKIFEINAMVVDLEAFLKIYVPLNLAYWKLYRENKIDKASLRFRRLKDTFDAMDADISTAMIYKLSEDYIRYLTTFNHLLDGSLEILEYLRPKYQLHIITNGFKEVQQGKLNKANIDHYFASVTNSEMVGVKKPDPRIFRHALDKARATPHTSVMVGDNYEADILGALDMGIEAICYNYHGDQLDDHINSISTLIELKQYL